MRSQGFSEKIKGPPYYQLGYKSNFVSTEKVCKINFLMAWIHLSRGIHSSVPGNHSSVFASLHFFPNFSDFRIWGFAICLQTYYLTHIPGHYVEGRQYRVQYMWMSLSCSCFFCVKLDGVGNGIILHGL